MKHTVTHGLRKLGSASAIVRLIAVCLLMQLFISLPAWIPAFREFPLVPAFPMLPIQLGHAAGTAVFSGLCVSLLALLAWPVSRWPVLAFAACALTLVLEDVTRFQPWLFLFSLLLIGTVAGSRETVDKRLRLLVGIVLSGTYLWSGLLKLNHAFTVEMFPWLVEFTGLMDWFEAHPNVAYTAAVAEALAGLGWWLPRCRKWALTLALCTHTFILLSFGPLGHNWNVVVLPWNVLFALLYAVAYVPEPEAPAWWKQSFKLSYARLVALLVIALPALNLLGWWDHFPSGSFYSSNVPEAIFYYHESDRAELPRSSLNFRMYTEGTEQEFILLDHWALDNLEVPMYPEARNHVAVGRQLCDCLNQPDSAGIRIAMKAQFTSEQSVVEVPCSELLAER